jgi:putative endonuclease
VEIVGFLSFSNNYNKDKRGVVCAVIPGLAIGRSPESITTSLGVVYYVYLMASRKHGTLYAGVTSNLVARAYQHKSNAVPGFTRRYHVQLLVWFECYDDPLSAIAREKEIKKWRRDWKINLIERTNPEWVDLYESLAQ